MKSFLGVLTILFCITLAVVIGNRLSAEAMAVVVGVVCGVVASIPMGLLLLVVAWRLPSGGQATRDGSRLAYGGAYPPVVIVNPGSDGRLPVLPYMSMPVGGTPAPRREFTIVGDDAE
jgi:hypothetical protein